MRFAKRRQEAKVAKEEREKRQQQEKSEAEKKAFFLERVRLYQEKKRLEEMRALSRATFSGPQLQEFQKALCQEKKCLLKDALALSEELSLKLCSELEKSGSSNHPADMNVGDSIVTQSLANNRKKRLKKIDEALMRINKGTYGICLTCFQPIAIGRLLSTPIADLCEQCKEEKEKQEGKRTKRINGAHYHYQELSDSFRASV